MANHRYTIEEIAVAKAQGAFPTASTVTISVQNVTDGTTETLTANACTQIGVTGVFTWPWSNLQTAPSAFTEYVYFMTDGLSTKGESVVFGGYVEHDSATVRLQYEVDFSLTTLDNKPIIKGDSFTVLGSADIDLTGYTGRALLVDKFDSSNSVEKLGVGLVGGDVLQLEIRPNVGRSEFDVNFLKGDTDLMGDKAVIEIQFDNIADPTTSKSFKKQIDFVKQEITD